MADKLLPLELPPGLYKNGTVYQSKGRWYDANGVRFIDKTIQPIGGWRRAVDDSGTNIAALSGVPRAALGWSGDTGTPIVGIGTTGKLYIYSAGALHDVTPVGFTTGRVDTKPAASTGAFGQGPFGVGPFGWGSLAAQLQEADTWTLDTFGSWLAGVCTSDQKLYLWEGNTAVPAAVPSGAPTTARAVVCTPEGFLVALGVNGDVRTLAWPTQRTTTDWTPTKTNSAGDFTLTTNGRLMCGARTRTETLLWTDVDLHAMNYIGGILIYRFDQRGDKCGIIAPNAKAVIDTRAFWMGKRTFYMYDGFAREIPCDVADYVFSNMNDMQVAKIWATTVAEFGEVWWYYCSSTSSEIDSYVVYNYRENHWNVGKLPRTAGFDAGSTRYPLFIDPTGVIYEHEVGSVRTGVTPYLESGPIELGDGDQVMDVLRLVPDEKTSGDVQAKFYASFFPEDTESLYGPYTLSKETGVRFAARQTRLRLEEARQKSWRVGTMRFGVQPAGLR